MPATRSKRLAAKKVSGGNTLRGPLQWAGPQDQYFAAIFLPDTPSQATMVTFRNATEVPKDPAKPDPNNLQKVEVLGAAVGSVDGITRERIFVGPKALDVLNTVHCNTLNGEPGGPDLTHVVDFGFFSLIARPLFLWLLWTHDHIAPNWGVSIIVLTVIINLALLPLRITSMKSALKMQKLQPQMKAIQERYKKYPLRDPKRADMNTEISALYKEHGANPAGGCLPLVIQMPFLFAFYSMLGIAIELRQAPFLWLHDLSSPDKLFILPVLIVLSTLFVAEDDSGRRDRPGAATHDDHHDAADAGLLQLVAGLGTQPVLGHRQLHRHRAAIRNEPHWPGQGNACRGRKTRPQGRKVGATDTLPCR